MKLIQNAINRIFNHWQSSLFGVSYAVVTWLYFHKDINTQEWIMAMGSLLATKGILVNKDPDKTANKPDAKP